MSERRTLAAHLRRMKEASQREGPWGPWGQRFRKAPSLIGYAADLTPVVAAKEAGASWNARGMAETVWKLECAVDFPGGKENDGKASGRTPERWPDTSKDRHGGDQLVLGERATNQ